MLDLLKVIHTLDNDNLFKGLGPSAISYLRKNGLWMPVTKGLFIVEGIPQLKGVQLYVEAPNHDNYLTFIIEREEFLTGEVFSNIDSSLNSSEGFLHRYSMVNSTLMYEVVQTVLNNIYFLALTDAQEEVYIGWEDREIESVLKLQT
jgi:hypothetical protein